MDASKFFDNNGNFRSIGKDIISHSGKRRDKVEGFFQAQITYNRKCKVRFHTEDIPFIFTSNYVFLSREEAINFLPFYVRKLIEQEDIPSEAIIREQETGKEYINQKMIIPQVMKLSIAAMEEIENGNQETNV